MNSSLASDLHGVPGGLFECRITPLHTISRPTRDFHLTPQSCSYSTSYSDWKVTQKTTRKHANREKKCVYSARHVILDKHRACVLPCSYEGLHIVFHFAYLYCNRTTKDILLSSLFILQKRHSPTHPHTNG